MKTADPESPAASAFLIETDITENAEGHPEAPEPAAEAASKWNFHPTGCTAKYRSTDRITCELVAV
jgi:hypothetical protein